MATTIAQISPFDIDNDNFVEYEERFSIFLIANGITDEGKKRATFIAIFLGDRPTSYFVVCVRMIRVPKRTSS